MLFWFPRAIPVVLLQYNHPCSNLIFTSKQGREVNPFIRAFFVMMRDPQGLGGDFPAFDKGLREFIADAGVDPKFIHDKTMDYSWAGEGWGGEENAEGGVWPDEEELKGQQIIYKDLRRPT